MDFENNLVDQLDRHEKKRDAYKTQMKRQKHELPRQEVAHDEKIKWLTEEVPELVKANALKINKMKDEDPRDDSWQTKLFQNCRTNNLIWHIKALDDPLIAKYKDFEEMIKDEPGSDDPIFLMEFNLQRKKEKAADALRQATFRDQRTEAQKRADLIKWLFKNQSPATFKRLSHPIEDESELTKIGKLLLSFKGREIHYDEEGKIDVKKTLERFEGQRRFKFYDYNPKGFSFEDVANELNKKLAQKYLKRQDS